MLSMKFEPVDNYGPISSFQNRSSTAAPSFLYVFPVGDWPCAVFVFVPPQHFRFSETRAVAFVLPAGVTVWSSCHLVQLQNGQDRTALTSSWRPALLAYLSGSVNSGICEDSKSTDVFEDGCRELSHGIQSTFSFSWAD